MLSGLLQIEKEYSLQNLVLTDFYHKLSVAFLYDIFRRSFEFCLTNLAQNVSVSGKANPRLVFDKMIHT